MLRVQEFMTPEVVSIQAHDAASTAAEQMRQHDLRHLVVMEEHKPVGVVSAHDFANLAPAALAGKTVGEMMARNVVAVSPRATVKDAANLMRGRAVGCLPVMDEGHLKGIVTISDLLELLGRGMQRPSPKGERRGMTRRNSVRRS